MLLFSFDSQILLGIWFLWNSFELAVLVFLKMLASFEILILFICLNTNFPNCVWINIKEGCCNRFQICKMISVRWILLWIQKHMIVYMYHKYFWNDINGIELQVRILLINIWSHVVVDKSIQVISHCNHVHSQNIKNINIYNVESHSPQR